MRVRAHGFFSMPVPLHSSGLTPDELKQHPLYSKAKAGNADAAIGVG
jgi:hypothetical protein